MEKMRKENVTCFSHWNKPTYNWSSGSGCVASTSTSASKNVCENSGTRGSSIGQQRFYSNSVATKSAGWTRQWHKPQTNSLKLTDTDCEMLSKQRCCWSCCGSGHCGADSVCPNKKKQDGNRKKRLNVMRKEHKEHVLSEELEKD